MERFINILIIDSDSKTRTGLKEILSGSSINMLVSKSVDEALPILQKKSIGIILISTGDILPDLSTFKLLKDQSTEKNCYILIISREMVSPSTLVKGINKGAVDFIEYPFNPNLIRSKIEVYKSLYYKDQRIGQLLGNIFPTNVLDELSTTGKYSPKRVQNGVVLFTDFVDFSSKARETRPLHLIKQLEKHFTRFDEIIKKYNLEKIKTIGDAYMALSGVTESKPMPAIRACLAALEIREYLRTERDIAIAMNRDFWEVRIGIHMGPLVAGIIGSSKFSFDVWGDTVNIASRAESATRKGRITITAAIAMEVEDYFELKSRGQIEIHKRGGSIEMFYLERLKPIYCLYGEGKYANASLRTTCGLTSMDFDHLRKEILNRLKSLLPENMVYHDIPHTLNVEKAAVRYAQLEGLVDEEILLLRTAVLFHDAGFIRKYDRNEEFGSRIAMKILPNFGYSDEQIKQVVALIRVTRSDVEPTNMIEMIMCDADHDYLGRADYNSIAKKLRAELENFGTVFRDEQWISFQLNFLSNHHHYYTDTARNIREQGKNNRIQELKRELSKLRES